jgi:hypothetical protein
MRYVVEIWDRGIWVPCVADDVLAEYETREDAEADACFAFANSECWRVTLRGTPALLKKVADK